MYRNKRWGIRKIRPYHRLLSCFMVMVMLFMMAPQNVEAYVGAIRDVAKGDDLRYSEFFNAVGQKSYIAIENDYIHFDLCVSDMQSVFNAAARQNIGRLAHTIPTAVLKDPATDNLDSFGVQQIRHQISTPADLTIDMNKVSFASMAEANALNWRDISNMTVKGYGRAKDHEAPLVEDGMYITFQVSENREMLDPEWRQYDYQGRYKITQKAVYDLTVFFELVRLDEGSLEAEEFPSPLYQEENPDEEFQHWGVHAVGKIVYEENDTNDKILKSEGLDWYRMNMTFQDFPKMGHPMTDKNVPSVYAQVMDSRGRNMFYKNISSGMEKSRKETVAEVCCNDYGFATPFVAASNRYNFWLYDGYGEGSDEGVQGHVMDPDDEGYGKFVEYKNYNLEVTGHEAFFMDEVISCHAHHLWGYRNLMSQADIDKLSQEPDVIKPVPVKISDAARKLYVVQNGDVYSVVEEEPANYVASYCGVYDKYGEVYRFYDGVLSLSPTINMKWEPKEVGGVEQPGATLTTSGQLQFDATKITLDTPNFVFYEPKETAKKESVLFLGYDVPGETEGESKQKIKVPYEGISLYIDAEQNDAIFNIDLPGNGVNVKRANIATSGNIVFGGELNINIFVAGLQMQELSYGGSGDDFGVNGLNAKGYIDTEKFSVLGFTGGAGRVEGEVNTFPGREIYAFSFELEVEDLFKTGAELELKRLSNGQLCPNNLFAKFRIEGDKGLDITPEAPVVTLQGLGLGAYGIADTVEQYNGGNTKAIPPVLLRAHAAGKVCKALDGELDVYVGPSKFRVEGNDLSVKDYKIMEQLGAEFYVKDAEFAYGGDQFKGYTVGGATNMEVKILPSGTSKNVSKGVRWIVAYFEDFYDLDIRGDVHATVAEAYVNKYGHRLPQRKIYGATSVSALIATKIDGKSILGYEVGTDIATRFTLESVTWDDGSMKAFTDWMNNLTLRGGFAADAYAGKMFAEVKYMIADGVKAAVGVNGNRTYVEELLDRQGEMMAEEELAYESGMEQLGDTTAIELEDGSYLIAVLATNTNELPITSEGAKCVSQEAIASEGAKAGIEEGLSSEKATQESADKWTDTITLQAENMADDQDLILVLTPKDAATRSYAENADGSENIDRIEAMADKAGVSLEDWKPVRPKDLSASEENVVSIEENEKLTVWSGKDLENETAESAEELDNVVYLSIDQTLLPDAVDGKVTIPVFADRDFTVKAMTTNPVTKVTGSVDPDGRLQPVIQNRLEDKEYTINTYYDFEDAEGNTSSTLIDSQTIEPGEEPEAIELPTNGIHVPTGSYTVSMQLFGGKGASVEEGGEKVESTLTLPINTALYFGSDEEKQEITIDYVNDNDAQKPSQPEYVNLTPNQNGNGVMDAAWTPVSGEDIDGYQITLYQKDDAGNFVSTDKGYNFTREQLENWENIDGLTKTEIYREDIGKMVPAYELQMAVTAYGVTKEEESEALSAESGLEADKDYKVGVCAYKKADDNIRSESEDGILETPMVNRQITSDETMSEEKTLLSPDPFDFEITASDGEVTKDGENGVYKYRSDAAAGRALILKNVKTASGTYLDTESEEANGDIEVLYTDPDTGEPVYLNMSANNPFDNWKEGDDVNKTREYWFALPDIDGLTQLTVRTRHLRQKEGIVPIYDETVKYIALENDNIAPVVGVDENEVEANVDGSFTVSGVANAGADIYIERQKVGTADENGIFTVSVNALDVSQEYYNICAMDEYGNESKDAVIRVGTHEHDLKKVEAKASTCREEGNIEYWSCTKCNKCFADENGESELTPDEIVVEKGPHTASQTVSENSVPADCVNAGYKDTAVVCAVCGAVISTEHTDIDALGHSYDTPTYTWREDGKSCIATAVCKREGCKEDTKGHKITETGTVTSSVLKEATTSEMGITLYTATFKNSVFSKQTRSVTDIPKKQTSGGGSSSGGGGSGDAGGGLGNGSDGSTGVPPSGIAPLKDGDTITDNKTNAKLEVTSDSKGALEATYVGPSNKKAKNATIPATVKKNGQTITVTTVAANALKDTKVTKVVVGKNIETMAPNAFAGSNVKTVIVKTKKLTKGSVKECLKGSKAKKGTVKVQVGSKKVNKKYVKKYRKIFTKKNVGMKVTVK